MRRSLLLLALLALAARPCAAASRQLKFTEYLPVRPAPPAPAPRLTRRLAPTQAETAVGLAVGLGTTGAVAVGTGNPIIAGAAGTAAGSAAAFQTGIFLRVMDCLRAPGECSLSSA